MLTIVCGEDTIVSRQYFQKLKDQYKSKGYEVCLIQKADPETLRIQTSETNSLFSEKRVFFSEHLVKFLKRSKSKEVLAQIQTIMKSDIEWIDWEQYSAREISNPKGATIKELKPSSSIFKLLDECYPGNLKQFMNDMNAVLESQEDGFIYAMLCKHIRSLVLAKADGLSTATSPWQKSKLSSQARLWTDDKLIAFYEGLARIDISVKTSSSPYGIKKSLDILACYLL